MGISIDFHGHDDMGPSLRWDDGNMKTLPTVHFPPITKNNAVLQPPDRATLDHPIFDSLNVRFARWVIATTVNIGDAYPKP